MRLVAFDNVASTFLLVWTGLKANINKQSRRAEMHGWLLQWLVTHGYCRLLVGNVKTDTWPTTQHQIGSFPIAAGTIADVY